MSGVAYLKYKSNNTIPAQPPSIPTLQNAWRKQHNPHFALWGGRDENEKNFMKKRADS